jgi:hypothetical protein
MSLELPLPTIDLHVTEREYKKIKKKLDTHARILIVIYSILFMDYKNPMHSKATRERIITAASTLVCYDLGYRKAMGKTMITR